MWTKEQFEEVKRQFPHPISAKRKSTLLPPPGSYCVGQALIESQEGIQCPFPSSQRLEEFLLRQIPVPSYIAQECAHRITEQNDAGNFDIAWLFAYKFLVKEDS